MSHTANIFSQIKGNNIVLMHSYIVNGHQLQCNAHTVPEQHKGTGALFIGIRSVNQDPPFFVTS